MIPIRLNSRITILVGGVLTVILILGIYLQLQLRNNSGNTSLAPNQEEVVKLMQEKNLDLNETRGLVVYENGIFEREVLSIEYANTSTKVGFINNDQENLDLTLEIRPPGAEAMASGYQIKPKTAITIAFTSPGNYLFTTKNGKQIIIEYFTAPSLIPVNEN